MVNEDDVKGLLKSMDGIKLIQVVDELATRFNVSKGEVALILLKMRLRGELTFSHCSSPVGFLTSIDALAYWLLVVDSILASLLALINLSGPLIEALRVILGVPAFVYVPGYAVLKVTYPIKKPFRPMETMLFSIGLSLALVGLISTLLTLTVGLTVQSALASMMPLNLVLLTIGYLREFRIKVEALPTDCF
ncbi:DUF1616 domain-containing protein [Caldivirga sp. UBA161]|uniref:DUF1616 domain-containing protein n=1 Tax=Caldivirga sp. UBA161 TaxID=1915569 RepID=UPI0025B90BEA|nr:DUF1616 domain-containing protein [Caldivirga sp. UBA161]